MRGLVKGKCGFFGAGRQGGVPGDPWGHWVPVCARGSEVVTPLLYSQEAPKTDGPPGAGEVGG